MKDYIPLIQLIVTSLITVIGLYLGPRFAVRQALRQFNQQELLKRRIDTYKLLLEDMSGLLNYYGDLFDHAIGAGPPRTDSQELKEARFALEKHSNSGGFIISERAEAAIQAVLRTVGANHQEAAPVAYDAIAGALRDSMKVVKQCANHDCNLR